MTTYGTIPSPSSPLPQSSPAPQLSSLRTSQYISLAKEHIRSGLTTCRPWRQTVESLSLPDTYGIAFSRLRTNIAYFRSNYAIVILLTLFLSLLYHPISLIVLIVTMSGWLFLYFLRDDPLVIFGRLIEDSSILLSLSVVTIGLLLLTDVTANIIVGLTVGVAAVLTHGSVRRIDDLYFDEEDLGGGPASRGGSAGRPRVVLRETTSDSFSYARPL